MKLIFNFSKLEKHIATYNLRPSFVNVLKSLDGTEVIDGMMQGQTIPKKRCDEVTHENI